MASELEQLRASFEEFKLSSAAVEEDLEYELASIEKILTQRDIELAHSKQQLAAALAKNEQSRDQFKRQTLSLEKQVDAFELSVRRLTEERRKLEQQKDDLERSNRVLQAQCEEQAEMCEILLEKEAVARLGLEDLEMNFHRSNLDHQNAMIKLKAAFKILYLQLKKFGQSPAIQLPEATPEELAELEAETEPEITRETRENAFRKFVEVVTAKRMQDQLATALAQLEQSKRRIHELEQDESPRPSSGEIAPLPDNQQEKKTINEGFLVKRGEGTLASWKRQLFRINTETHTLEYYFVQVRKNNTKRIKLGEIPLPQASITVAQKEGSHDSLFHVKPRFSKRTYVLQAASAEERNLWLAALSGEAEIAPKINPDSLAEAHFKIEKRGKGFIPCFCILLQRELQLFNQQSDEKPSKSYPLKDCQVVYLPSEKHLLAFDYGPGLEVQHVILDCGSAEKLGEWTSLLQNAIAEPSASSLGGEPDEREDTVEVDLTVPLNGRLKLLDEAKEFWEEYHFEVAADTNFLDFYAESGTNGSPSGTIPLLSARQDGTSTAIISSYPPGAYVGHDYVFGITPPFSNLTWLLDAGSQQLLVKWMDGLVTLLDSKVARDPFSAKEGYLYKAVKDSTNWGKKYVMLDPPQIKYYKAGRHTNATVLTLTGDSQILLRAPTKKFAVVFSLREGPGSREYLWGSKDQVVGESWLSALQAVITKRRAHRRQSSNPVLSTRTVASPSSVPLLPSPKMVEETKGGTQPRQVVPRTLRTRSGSAVSITPTRLFKPDFAANPKNGVDTEKIATAAAEFAAIVRQRTEDKRPLPSTPTSPGLAAARPSTSTPLSSTFPPASCSSSSSSSLSSVASFSSLNFNFNFNGPKKSATLNVLKTSLFSTSKWSPTVFELSRNGRVLTYYDAEKHNAAEAAANTTREASDHCPVAGCSAQPFARFGGLCAHHFRKSKKKNVTYLWYLVGAEVEIHPPGQYAGHEFTFSLSGAGGPALVLEAASAQERVEWTYLLMESGMLKRYMYPDSAIEGRLAQLNDGEWKEKYYVVRHGRFECYNRSNKKKAWEVQLKASTRVRSESFGASSDSTARSTPKPSAFSCVNAERSVDPEGVFIVLLEKEKLVLGVFPKESSRDVWIDALQSCITLAAVS